MDSDTTRSRYDVLGNLRGVTLADGTAPDYQPFGLAGGLSDSQTGLVRFGARDYDLLCSQRFPVELRFQVKMAIPNHLLEHTGRE